MVTLFWRVAWNDLSDPCSVAKFCPWFISIWYARQIGQERKSKSLISLSEVNIIGAILQTSLHYFVRAKKNSIPFPGKFGIGYRSVITLLWKVVTCTRSGGFDLLSNRPLSWLFSTFDWNQLAEICPQSCKKCLEISEAAKFESY